MQTLIRYVIVFVMGYMPIFLIEGSFSRGADAKEMNPDLSSGVFELGQLVGLGQSDLSLKFFFKEDMIPWGNRVGASRSLAGSQLTSNLLMVAPGANFVIGNIVSLDMKLGYGDFQTDPGNGQAGNQSIDSEIMPQWRWFSSISLSSYHQVRGIDLHGRIGFRRFIMEDFVDLHSPNASSSRLAPGSSDGQGIDARLGLTLGRIEPFLGGLYAYRSSGIPGFLFDVAERPNGVLTDGASVGLRGGFRFVIGEMSGGIVGSRRLRDSGRESNSLEGNIRIKF